MIGIFIAGIGAALMILTACNLQPSWLSPQVAFLASLQFLLTGVVLVERKERAR